MHLPWLATDDPFPPTQQALGADSPAPGLLAAGADLSPQRLEAAYGRGIFPWYSAGEPPLWWAPDPRMVLPVAEFKLQPSLRKTLRRFLRTPGCTIRVDHAFFEVMQACASSLRHGESGTWIQPEMVVAYCAWHAAGVAHSVETWIDGELAGGLYAVNLGRMVFGESMFARRTDASKIALAWLVAFCRAQGIEWIDCQQQTAHLASLGARPVPRAQFEAHLARAVPQTAPPRWNYDPAVWAQLGLSAAG